MPSLPPGFVISDDKWIAKFETLDNGDVVETPLDEKQKENLSEYFKKLNIVRLYDVNSVYGFLRDNLEAMEQLYEWALSLPNFNKM